MDWKNVTWKSIWKLSKEKLIFVFCSGLLLFVLALPGDEDSVVAENRDTVSVEQEHVEDAVSVIGKAAAEEIPYESLLEEKIKNMLSGVDGVGDVDVMIVLKSSEEKILRVDKTTSTATTEDSSGGSGTRKQIQQQYSEDTVMDGQSSAPIVEKELYPELSGIVISADGGGSAVVKAEISEAMEALFGLPPHKIKVLKRVKEGV